MAEADKQRGDVGAVLEDAKRHYGVDGEFPFVDEEEADGDKAEDDEADHGGRCPGVANTTVFKAEEEHDRAADNRDGTEPVDGF